MVDTLRNRLIALVILVLFIFGSFAVWAAGLACPVGLGQQEWELEVWVSDEQELENGDVQLDVAVHLSGHASATTVRNATLEFEDSDGNAYHSVAVGTVSGFTNETVTVQLNERPERIRLEAESIEIENDDTEYWVKGVELRDGEYEQFVQEHRGC